MEMVTSSPPEVFLPDRNARLTVHGRQLLVDRVVLGRPVRAAVADHLGRAPNRAELTAARRAARSLAALGKARLLYVPGADAGDR